MRKFFPPGARPPLICVAALLAALLGAHESAWPLGARLARPAQAAPFETARDESCSFDEPDAEAEECLLDDEPTPEPSPEPESTAIESTEEAALPEGELPPPDALENNYDLAHAATIGVGISYALNFSCPDIVVGCVDGDHDYLRAPVKAGTRYLAATYDLGPGTDTVIELFEPEAAAPFAGNDDHAPGLGLLSALSWVPAHDGVIVIRVGPAHHAGSPRAPGEGTAGSYRFQLLLADSEAGRELAALLDEQSGLPAATPTPEDESGPAELPIELAPAADAPSFDDPPAPPEAPPGGDPSPAEEPLTSGSIEEVAPEAPAFAAAYALSPEAIRALPAPSSAATPIQPQQVALPIVVCRRLPDGTCPPLAGLRAQLALALDGRVLAEASTDAEGAATLLGAAIPGHVLQLRVPALGLSTPVTLDTQPLRIVVGAQLPEEARR
jgi:hypothetical protein